MAKQGHMAASGKAYGPSAIQSMLAELRRFETK